MTIIRAQRLTKFSVAADGGSIAIGVADEEGRAGALTLSIECLRELMMTLPEMMRRALRPYALSSVGGLLRVFQVDPDTSIPVLTRIEEYMIL